MEDERGRDLPDTASITRPLPIDEVRKSISEVVDRARDQERERALDLVTVLEVRARLENDSGERLTLDEFAADVGFDLDQLRAAE